MTDAIDALEAQDQPAPLPEFKPSDKQAAAIAEIVDWYQNRSQDQQVFRLFGFAGTGKTTTLKYALAELSAETMPRITKRDRDEVVHIDFKRKEIVRVPDRAQPPRVINLAFTGKASLVMTRKGTPASTIHSAIYAVQEPTKEAIDRAKDDLRQLLELGPSAGITQLMWSAMVRDRENQIKNMHRPTFILNDASVVQDCDLIVLDEVSMVGPEMASDILSFGKPILVLGDPGQLPPIEGEGAFTHAEPDIMLTEIHRQAEDSAIIRLATMAREGRPIPYGRHSDDAWKMPREQAQLEWLLKSNQVLCGMNATRLMLNNEMRKAAGFGDVIPNGDARQKLICLKNQSDIGLVNGMFVSVTEIQKPSEKAFRAHIVTEDDTDLGWQTVYNGHFLDHETFDKGRGQKDYFDRKGKVELTWGYGITVHKSQGSGWPTVCLYDDGFGRGDDRKRWLYTAITRAETGLLILG